MTLRILLSTIVCLAMTAGALAQKRTLSVGDPAPGLDIQEWVKNEATTLESGKVYVVEFWATWCVPCKKSIPHLNTLSKQYSDEGLTIIGVSDEEVGTVSSFVRAQGDKMSYTVAVDRMKGTGRAWMNAANVEGIPAAFIVDRRGKIAFIGHPLDEKFESTLLRVLEGRFDPALEKQAAPVLEQARQARRMKNWRLATMHYEQVIALDAQVFAETALEYFDMQLVDMGNKAQAYQYASTSLIGQLFASDAGALQMLAEKIASDPKINAANRDLDVALEAAEASRRVAGANDAKALSALAMVRYHRGEVAQAVELQRSAYFSAKPRSKPEFKRLLNAYQQAADRAAMSTKSPS